MPDYRRHGFQPAFTPCCGKRTANTVEASLWGIEPTPDPQEDPGYFWHDRAKVLEADLIRYLTKP